MNLVHAVVLADNRVVWEHGAKIGDNSLDRHRELRRSAVRRLVHVAVHGLLDDLERREV